MSGLAGNKKRTTRKRSLILIGILVLFVLQADAEQKDKFAFGVYTGWSLGLRNGFGWNSTGHYDDALNLIFHMGGYTEYKISRLFGLQFNINFQGVSHREIYKSFYEASRHETTLYGFFNFNLNGVFNYLRLKNTQFYLLGGAGISLGNLIGDWESFYGKYFNFMSGTGVKIYFKPNSRNAINLGGRFYHLMKPKYHYNSAEKVNYLQFQIGYEFYPNEHKN